MISPEGILALKAYSYKSGGYSPLETFINPFWLACVELLPMVGWPPAQPCLTFCVALYTHALSFQWMAPNLVTLIGTLSLVLPFIAVLVLSPGLDEALPPWLCVLAGLAVFVYSTMDAIDGKQARRTKSSSPLGQLFDHGKPVCRMCDIGFIRIPLVSQVVMPLLFL